MLNVKIVPLPLIPAPVVSPRICSWSPSFRLVYHFLSLNHHLYADDIQLFFSFYPSDIESSITHLQNALQQISSWMTANLLILNSSKIEFLLNGLKQQLAKLSSCSLDTAHSACNLFLDSFSWTHPFLTRYQLCLNPATRTCVNFTASDHPDHKTASTITNSILHSKLDYCNSLYYNLPNTQLYRLQHIQNSLTRAIVKALKSSHINRALKSLHWLFLQCSYSITENIIMDHFSSQDMKLNILRSTDHNLTFSDLNIILNHNFITVSVLFLLSTTFCSLAYHQNNAAWCGQSIN